METVTVLPSPIVYDKWDPNINLDVREEGRKEELQEMPLHRICYFVYVMYNSTFLVLASYLW